jgi:outer membrane protein TolC
VTKAYYTVLINKERKLIFESNIARLDSLLRTTTAMYQAGFAEKIDVDRIKVSLNNLKAEYANFQNMDMLALYLLKFQMNFPFNEPLEIGGSIADQLPSTSYSPDLAGWDYSMRPEYRVLLANQKLQQLNIRNQYAEGMPSLVAFANMGYNTQSPNVAGIFRTESNIANENGLGPDKWYNYSLIGVSLSWNMFTGLSRNFRIQQEKLTLMKLENGFQALERGIDLERLQAQAALENAQKNLEVQTENIQLATDIVAVTRKKYEVGVGSNIELINAENSLREAQVNYYEALYNTLIAKTDLLKSLGILQNSK